MSALTQWQREVAAGTRDRRTVDALSRAACAEANDRDFERAIGKSLVQFARQERDWHREDAAWRRAHGIRR
jgi:hypothetical protein